MVNSLRLIAVGHRQSINVSVSCSTWFNQFNRTNLYQLQSNESTIVIFDELTGLT